jgi:hypothetical protein
MTPLSMEPLLFGTVMPSSDMLSRSLRQQLVYATSVLADESPHGRDAHYNCRPACPDIGPVGKHPNAVMSAACANKGKAELNYIFEDMWEAVRKCQCDVCHPA